VCVCVCVCVYTKEAAYPTETLVLPLVTLPAALAMPADVRGTRERSSCANRLGASSSTVRCGPISDRFGSVMVAGSDCKPGVASACVARRRGGASTALAAAVSTSRRELRGP
jgi:hypothetical protein